MDILLSQSSNARHAYPAHRDCSIGRPGRDFGWSSFSTRKPSRRFSRQCWEAVYGLDTRPRAKRLPSRERLSQQRCAPLGATFGHGNLSTLRQQRAADRFRFDNRPEGGGHVAGTLCRRPLASVRRMSASLGAGLRQTPAPLSAGQQWFAPICGPTDALQKGPEGVVLLPTSGARSVIPWSARCTQRALLRKTKEPSCMERHVVCSFETSRTVLNVPVSGKEGRDD